MEPAPEFLPGAQSVTVDIHNRPDGKFAVLTFFTLPNGKENPDNKTIARFGIPYDMLLALPTLIQNLITQNDQKTLKE